MNIYERIKLITTAFKHLNGYIPDYFAPMSSDLLGVKVCLNGVYVDAIGVAFNDLINGNLSLTIHHPKLNRYPVCLKLHISRDGELEWHDDWAKGLAEEALGEGVTPEDVLCAIQDAVSYALSDFVRDIQTDLVKISR